MLGHLVVGTVFIGMGTLEGAGVSEDDEMDVRGAGLGGRLAEEPSGIPSLSTSPRMKQWAHHPQASQTL